MGERIDLFEHVSLVVAQARLLVNSGEPDAALSLFEQARQLAEQQGNEVNAAVVLGDIARLRANKGEVEEALRLQEECLNINRQLGDLDGQAAALWDIAQIELGRNDVAKAAPLIVEAYQLFDHIGRLEGICVVGTMLGQLLVAAVEREQGLAVLQRSEHGYRQMQRHHAAAQVGA